MKKIILRYALGALVLCSSVASCSSTTKITKNQVERKKEQKEKFRTFKTSKIHRDSLKNFNFHVKTYLINSNFDTTWKAYTNSSAEECWKGPLNTFKQSYSKNEGILYSAGEKTSPTIELGMVYELNLRCANLVDVGVAFEITKVDSSNKIIEFTYGAENKSKGKQTMQFIDQGSQTLVVHYSHFRSDSKVRDRYLYPLFHEKCMDEFHNNLKTKIENINITRSDFAAN